MASKLAKLQGIPRIAQHDMQWYGFRVRQGYAFGLDNDGNLYVSPGMPAVDGNLFVWRAYDDTPVKCTWREEVTGHFSQAIGGRQPVIREAGFFATEWSLRWKPASIPAGSTLAQRIREAKRQAKPCAQDPYRGLRRLYGNMA